MRAHYFFLYGSLSLIAYYLESIDFFIYAASYIHYVRYVDHYYHRRKDDHDNFVSDARTYKNISQVCLFYAYLSTAGFKNYLSLLIAAMGYVISVSSYLALGHDGTYFGIEMGLCEPCFTLKWPYGNYGYLPGVWHPMYMGQVYSLIGLMLVPEFRAAYPLLAPIHIGCYAVCIA